MIIYVLKSILCMAILYGFYRLFLQKTKAFVFIRFYLLFSLVFSLITPLIEIPIGFNFWGSSKITLANGAEISNSDNSFWTAESFRNILLFLYFAVCLLFILRFFKNLHKIIKLIRKNSKKQDLVLVGEKIMPFSFVGYIFVNENEHETGKIQKELIRHEQVHCRQHHSIDILFSEVLKCFMWFNPFVWLIGKAIQQNHEYLADNVVISQTNLLDYQQTLINYVFRNNSIQLVSNFYYSFTKNRLKMMEIKSPKNVIYRILAVIPLFLLLVFFIANCNEKEDLNKKSTDLQNAMQGKKVSKEFYATKEAKEAIEKGLIPPPPPPPPPTGDKKVLKNQTKPEDAPPPPPPPPPTNEVKSY